MSKVTDARITAIKALFEKGDKLTEDNLADLIDAIQEAAQEHEHVSTGGPGSGTGDAGAAINLQSGLAAEKPGTPAVGDIYVETDTSKVYACFSVGSWTDVTGGGAVSPHASSHAVEGSDKLKYTRQIVFYIPGTLEVGTNQSAKITYRGPTSTIVRADGNIEAAPTGQAAIFDINIGGTSIWDSTPANRLQIAASAINGTQTSFDTTTVSDGDVFTIDTDQVGSGDPGDTATVHLELECNPETD